MGGTGIGVEAGVPAVAAGCGLVLELAPPDAPVADVLALPSAGWNSF